MHCETCKFAPPVDSEGFQDECPLFEKHGVTFKDGKDGCRIPYSKLAAQEEQYLASIADSADSFGLEHDFEGQGINMEKTIEACKHMVGFHIKDVYHRHGKGYYKAYRNYWAGNPREDFEIMCHQTYSYMTKEKEVRDGSGYTYYYLTEKGLRWLSGKIGVTIKPGV